MNDYLILIHQHDVNALLESKEKCTRSTFDTRWLEWRLRFELRQTLGFL